MIDIMLAEIETRRTLTSLKLKLVKVQNEIVRIGVFSSNAYEFSNKNLFAKVNFLTKKVK